MRGEALSFKLWDHVLRSSSSRTAAVAAIAIVVAGCGFQTAGTGSNASFGDSAPELDSGGSALDAGDTSIEHDGGSDDGSDATIDTAMPDVAFDDGAPTDDGDAGCMPKVGDLCKDVSHLPGSQIIDGKADDFCGVEETTFDVHDGQFTDPMVAPAYVSAIARVHVAWSTVGVHLHFAVSDATYFPTPAARPHWQGDSVELFIYGNDTFTGAYDGVIDRGAVQLIFVPPSPETGIAARAGIYYKGGTTSELPDAYWTSREVAGGYEIEVGLPWDYIGGFPPYAPPKKIGIDFAVNDVIDAARSQYFYSVYRIIKPIPAGSCGTPFCDDRVWCKSALVK